MTSALRVMELEYPLPPKEALPTMYDLPSEEIGQLGMPDLFHEWQARLLDETFQPPHLIREEYFSAIDMNLYYDVHHTNRCKRPDWFAVVGLSPEKYPGMRMSYVQWQEEVTPLLVVELLSPSTQKDDLGQLIRDVDGSPTKWDVYEQWLQVPYYVTFSGRKNELRIFRLQGARYEPVTLEGNVLWIEEAQLGIGLWRGRYLGEERLWLRWQDRQGNWIPTSAERAEEARLLAEAERSRANEAQAHAEEESARAQEAQARADEEAARAQEAQARADEEAARAEKERLEKEAAQLRAQLLAEKLRALGVDPDSI